MVASVLQVTPQTTGKDEEQAPGGSRAEARAAPASMKRSDGLTLLSTEAGL